MTARSLTTSLSAGRFDELDSLRAIAALGVIGWHYVHAFGAAPFGHVLAPFYGRGLLMVDFFFVLSGFVLARAFWNDQRSPQFAENLKARVARIYPLHLVMLFAVVGMQAALSFGLGQEPFVYKHNTPYNFGLNILLLNGSGLQNGFSFNAPSWSISTEFLVNLAFLAMIVAPRRVAAGAMAVAGSLAAAAMVSRGLINATPAFGWIDNDLVRTAAGFFVGVAAHGIYRRVPPPPSILADLASIAIAAASFVYLAGYVGWGNTGDVLTCLVGFPILIVSVVHSRLVRAALSAKWIVYLGTISYSIYLVHFPLQLAVHILDVSGTYAPNYSSRWFFLGFISAVVLTASATYRLVELPGKVLALRLLRRRHLDAAIEQVAS